MKKTKYNIICTFAIILTFIMTFQTISFAVVEVYEDIKNPKDFLTEENTIIEDDFQQDIVGDTSNSLENKVIVAEDESLRNETERHFICDDGTRIVASYPEQVCYQDEDGIWQMIDNSLLLSEDRIINKGQKMQVSFSTESKADKMVSLNCNDIELSWSVEFENGASDEITQQELNNSQEAVLNDVAGNNVELNASFEKKETQSLYTDKLDGDISNKKYKDNKRNNVKAVVEELKQSNDIQETTYEKFVIADKLTSTLIYTDIYSDTIDASYTVLPNKIKENIILSEKTNIESYSMNIICEDLIAEITKDNSVVFIDAEGNVQYIIQTPYMYDDIYEISYDIKIDVEKNEVGYKITFSPDLDWLNSEDRVYPITIDPTVRTSTDKAHFSDTYVYEGCSASDSRRYEERLRVGVYSDKIYRAFWKAETLPTLPNNTIITNASYVLKFYDCTTSGNFRLYGVNGSWESNTITWDNADNCTYTLLQSNVARNASTQTLTFNSSKLVDRLNSWYNGNSNDGFLICYYNESKTDPDYNLFYSSDNTASASYKPYLLMEYQTYYTATNMKIYESPESALYDEFGNYAEDLQNLNLSKEELCDMDYITSAHFLTGVSVHRANWEGLAKLVSQDSLEVVALDMIGKFMSGDNSYYTNSVLTSEAKAHDSSIDYIAEIKSCLNFWLIWYQGDISQLKYPGNYSDRTEHPMVSLFLENKVVPPNFGSVSDIAEGLTICIDNPWANNIYIDSYTCIGDSYSGVVTVNLYDHFGIDTDDYYRKYKNTITYGSIAGFRSWYILQHYEGYNEAYKPFLTVVSFSFEFSGTI